MTSLLRHATSIAVLLAAISTGEAGRPVAKASPTPDQVQFIDQKIRDSWNANDLTPSAQATDAEFCRRIFLSVLGRIPTVDELFKYRADKAADKASRLIDQLLHHYEDEYARNWTTIWTNTLIGRSGGNDDDNMVSRSGMELYLRDAFSENRSYQTMVRELVGATGTNIPGTENFNGAVNFLSGKLNEDASQATAQTSRIFLGIQVQCTQCHNHPFNDWKQQKYWQMNSFFRQTVALRRFKPGSNDVRMIELTDQDFAGEETNRDPESGRIFYELRNGKLEAATPVFLDGTKIESSGYLADSNRRKQLADLVATSDLMSRAIVNRMWAHFFGYGFTKPIDDLGPHNAPSHPELLDYLAEQFQKNSYDLKQLMRWIVLSEAYSLSSKTTNNNERDDPQLGEQSRFSHYYLRQMTAEQLYESLLVATEAHMTSDAKKREETKQRWLKQFTIAFGTDEGDDTTTFNGTIPQTLMMFNGDLIKRATSAEEGSFLHRIAYDSQKNNKKKINHLYLAALARTPTRAEIKMADQLLRLRKGDVTSALQDIWWALLNSNEFILNH